MRAYFDSDNNFIYEGIDLSNLRVLNTPTEYTSFVLPTYHNAYVQHTVGSVLATVDMGNIHSDETNPWDDTLPLFNAYGGVPQPLNLKLPYIIEDDGTTVKWCKSKIALFMCVRREGDFVSGYRWRAAFLFYKGYRAYHSPTSGSIQYEGQGIYYNSSGIYYQSYYAHGEWICHDYFSTREDLVEWMQNLEIEFPTWKVYDNGYIQSVDYVHRNSQAGADMDAWLLSDEGWNMTQNWDPYSLTQFINVYRMGNSLNTSIQAVKNFQNALWTLDADSLSDAERTVSSRLYSNPMDCIVGMHVVPFPVTNVGSSVSTVRVGIQDLSIGSSSAYRVANEWSEHDIGQLLINRPYNDYRDFTEVVCQIYLPCIGWKSLDPQLVMGKYVGVKYRVNCITGDMMAILYVNDTSDSYGDIFDSMKGSALMQCPISGRDFTSYLQARASQTAASVGAIGTIAAGAGTGAAIGSVVPGVGTAIGAVAGGIVGGVAGAGLAASKMKAADANVSKALNTVQKDGAIGGTSAYLGYDKVYIIVMSHDDANAVGYQNYHGYPTNKTLLMSTLSGYVQAKDVYFASTTATDEEKAEIEQLLKGGVFI